jgi:hypothetical protein
LLSRRLWRLRERQRRAHVESTGTPLTGGEKKPTERPTACMMLTKFAGVLGRKVDPQRQRARPLSAVPQQSLVALRGSAPCCTLPAGEQRSRRAATRLSQRQKRLLRWLAAEAQRTRGGVASRHQELVCALKGDKGNSSHRRRTWEARNWLIIGRSAGGRAAALRLPPAGQKGACQFAGRCDEGAPRGARVECVENAAGGSRQSASRIGTLSHQRYCWWGRASRPKRGTGEARGRPPRRRAGRRHAMGSPSAVDVNRRATTPLSRNPRHSPAW